MFQYFVKVVPTRYRQLSGQELKSNQYSVTTHKVVMDPMRGEHGLPGIVHLFGIESPGLTSSLSLAEAVADRLDA